MHIEKTSAGLLDIMREKTANVGKQIKDSIPAEEVIPPSNSTEPSEFCTLHHLNNRPHLPGHNGVRTREEKLRAKKARKMQKAARKRNRR